MKKILKVHLKSGDVIEIGDSDDTVWNIMKNDEFDWNKTMILDNKEGDILKRIIINMSEVVYINYA